MKKKSGWTLFINNKSFCGIISCFSGIFCCYKLFPLLHYAHDNACPHWLGSPIRCHKKNGSLLAFVYAAPTRVNTGVGQLPLSLKVPWQPITFWRERFTDNTIRRKMCAHMCYLNWGLFSQFLWPVNFPLLKRDAHFSCAPRPITNDSLFFGCEKKGE